jgi:hypothetical protein
VSAMGSNVGRRLPIAARGCLPTSLGRAKYDRLVAGGALDGDVTWLLERVPEEVAMSALSRALCSVLKP